MTAADPRAAGTTTERRRGRRPAASYLRYRDGHHPEWVLRAYALAPPAFAAVLEDEVSWLVRACRGGPLVEVGCGGGRLMRVLCTVARPVIGVDLVLRYLRAAAVHVPEAVLLCADAFCLPLQPACARTVILGQATLGSLGGEPRRRKMIDALAPIVAPGGVLLVSAYGPGCRAARAEWYRAQQREGLLPPFAPGRTRTGRFVFAGGFTSAELEGPSFARLRPRGFRGEVEDLPSGLRVATWERLPGDLPPATARSAAGRDAPPRSRSTGRTGRRMPK